MQSTTAFCPGRVMAPAFGTKICACHVGSPLTLGLPSTTSVVASTLSLLPPPPPLESAATSGSPPRATIERDRERELRRGGGEPRRRPRPRLHDLPRESLRGIARGPARSRAR